MNNNIQEKILWIDSLKKYSGLNNNFYYNIFGYLPTQAKNITVQLLNAFVAATENYNIFNSKYIKILIDFGCSNNQVSLSNNNLISLGIINNHSKSRIYESDNITFSSIQYTEIESQELVNQGPIYNLNSIPNNIFNIQIHNHNNTVLLDEFNTAPDSVILCLKFTYEI